ncbi:MAG: DUF5107 domain-containing protein [Flavisolibacter sp.]
MDNFSVRMWKEEVSIPTYETGLPDKNPMFFEKRVYQGSSGAVYPHPIIEKIHDEKVDKKYQAVFLENQYIKVMVLPELGGRIQMAFDKIGNRHFIYYNEVIKPALVGLCGPWISGGIEFNWPQHHRPSTFEPIDFALEENEDGSKTVWVNEIEKMNRTKGMAGFTLHPEKAYLEVRVKLFNRSPFPQSFLWWANPAVHVNDQYQSIFPPDVHAVFDHGRRDVSDFPIARGVYYKVDYAPGTDISRYKNIPVPTSYMAVNSAYDFVGGYEHDSRGGLLHVANHHLSPGKKQWTWGNGDFGKAWDRNLTDTNGPYIELMTGVFTDNQPDFSWIMPYEEKEFSQYFLPYRELGIVNNASKEVLLHFSIAGGKALLKLFATSILPQVTVTITSKQGLLKTFVTDLSPENIFETLWDLTPGTRETDCKVIVRNNMSQLLLTYQPQEKTETPLPEAARAPLSPQDTPSNELLFLTGLHLEQYRHATCSPLGYYEEALLRDAGDIRCNNALGLWHLRRGLLKKSEPYFRKAIETLTRFNPNPYDGEPFYNLGLCLQFQQRLPEAYDAFYKAAWSSAWQANSFFALAQIDLVHEKPDEALEHIQQSLRRNMGNRKAIALKAAILRKKNLPEALDYCQEALRNDAFNLPLYFEQYKWFQRQGQSDKALAAMNEAFNLARADGFNFIEYAIDFAAAGMYGEAIEWLELLIKAHPYANRSMVQYYLGWSHEKAGNHSAARSHFLAASSTLEDAFFPNRVEDIEVLEAAFASNPSDYKAAYYLGCLWYDKKQYFLAIDWWQKCIEINKKFAGAYRNLGIAYYNKVGDEGLALQCFEEAFRLNPSDGRILMELDQLRKRMNHLPSERLELLERQLPQVLSRDDLYLERAAIYNFLGQPEKAYELIMQHKFHPWEGGEGKVPAQYKSSLIQKAKKAIADQQCQKALALLEQAQTYPDNLGEGKLYGTPENEIFYWMGCAYEGMHQNQKAQEYFERATQGVSQPAAAIFYNDPQPDSIFYQGLAWKKLRCSDKATDIFNALVNYGEKHVDDRIKLDFFAVSLPDLLVFDDDLDRRNKIHCLYMMGLGQLGLGQQAKAQSLFEEVSRKDAMHAGAMVHMQLIALSVQDQMVKSSS